MQVGKLDMTNSSHHCPPGIPDSGLTYTQASPGKRYTDCSVMYNQVCGKIIAYKDESLDGFYRQQQFMAIDQNYVYRNQSH